MVINKHNLSIASHCGKRLIQGHSCDKLYVTENSTFAVTPVYAVSVSALSPGKESGYITPASAEALSGNREVNIKRQILPNSGPMPALRELLDTPAPVLFEMKIDLKYLLKLVQSAVDFEGEIVRLRFTGNGEGHPVRLDCRNTTTGQTWEAVVMGRFPNNAEDTARYAEPDPLSDFDRAMLEAAKLGL